MTLAIQRPLAVRILPDLLAFALGLGLAYFMKWETRDLVWSLWLSSLTLGYLTILSAVGGAAYVGIHLLRRSKLKGSERMRAILGGLGGGAFFLGFFSLHFCGFHAGHSVFLNSFFPLAGVPNDGFGSAFVNPFRLWMLVFKHLMAPYGLFLVAAIVAERNNVFRPLITSIRAMRTGNGKDRGNPADEATFFRDAMGRPYLNVVRMHILIFFFAACHAVKADSFFIYAVVYTVYFFPWRELKRPPQPAPSSKVPGHGGTRPAP